MIIFYGVCGEGRGHAARSYALIERLREIGHQVYVFTSKDGHDFFMKSSLPEQFIYKIAGLHFVHNETGISVASSMACAVGGYFDLQASYDFIDDMADVHQPGLFITDFEPGTAFVASYRGIPCVSIDNQHKFCKPLPKDFPLRVRAYATMVGLFVNYWITPPNLVLVSTFHEHDHNRIEAMLRRKIAAVEPAEDDYILVYAKHSVGKHILRCLEGLSERVVVYGFSGGPQKNVEYHPISHNTFIHHLAECKAVICCSGNQLLSEAKYFGKKVLGVPLPAQTEQEINAMYLQRESLGDYCYLNDLSTNRIKSFLKQDFKIMKPENGVDQAIRRIGELVNVEGNNQDKTRRPIKL